MQGICNHKLKLTLVLECITFIIQYVGLFFLPQGGGISRCKDFFHEIQEQAVPDDTACFFSSFLLPDSISDPLEWCRTQSGCTVPSGISQLTKEQNHDIYQIRNQYRRPMNYHKKHNGFNGVLRIAQDKKKR